MICETVFSVCSEFAQKRARLENLHSKRCMLCAKKIMLTLYVAVSQGCDRDFSLNSRELTRSYCAIRLYSTDRYGMVLYNTMHRFGTTHNIVLHFIVLRPFRRYVVNARKLRMVPGAYHPPISSIINHQSSRHPATPDRRKNCTTRSLTLQRNNKSTRTSPRRVKQSFSIFPTKVLSQRNC